MTVLLLVKCDLCNEEGVLTGAWATLRDFSYIKHACPKCAERHNYGDGSHLRDSRISTEIRNKARK